MTILLAALAQEATKEAIDSPICYGIIAIGLLLFLLISLSSEGPTNREG